MKWFIPGNTPSSKNSRQWTGKYFITSKTVTKYRQATNAIYMELKESFTEEFNQLDERGDGHITIDEFQHFLKHI